VQGYTYTPIGAYRRIHAFGRIGRILTYPTYIDEHTGANTGVYKGMRAGRR